MSDWAPVLILLAAMRANTEKVIEAIKLSEEATKKALEDLNAAIDAESQEIQDFVAQEIQKATAGSVPQAEVDAMLGRINTQIALSTQKVRDLVTLDAPPTEPPVVDNTLPGAQPTPTPYGKRS